MHFFFVTPTKFFWMWWTILNLTFISFFTVFISFVFSQLYMCRTTCFQQTNPLMEWWSCLHYIPSVLIHPSTLSYLIPSLDPVYVHIWDWLIIRKLGWIVLLCQDWYSPIHGYLSLLVCILGAVFNSVNILVLSHKTLR